MNYYRILQISEKATNTKIKLAYIQLTNKWQKIKTEQPSIPSERVDNILSAIEQAYQVLSNPEKRAAFDRTLQQTNSQTPNLTIQKEPKQVDKVLPDSSSTPEKTKVSYKIIILIVLLILISMAYGYYHFIFNTTTQNPTQQIVPTAPQPESAVANETLDNTSTAIEKAAPSSVKDVPAPTKQNLSSAEENFSSKKETSSETAANEDALIGLINTPTSIEQQPNPAEGSLPSPKEIPIAPIENIEELSEISQKIADSANKYRNTVINNNTLFLGAAASEQNVRLNFKVIEGISDSKLLLSTYLKERFIYDNNICKTQEEDIKRGNTFTFAYYNADYQILGSYIIDQQVCDSPLERRMIKKASDE